MEILFLAQSHLAMLGVGTPLQRLSGIAPQGSIQAAAQLFAIEPMILICGSLFSLVAAADALTDGPIQSTCLLPY
jgi:hypothetical protein